MGLVKKLPVNNFEWIKDVSQFNEDFIKSYNKESDEGFHHFYLTGWRFQKSKSV